ncbi:MAG: hypothetical protein U9N12_02120 [Euryarchaeota archaeon]|nr:hypothetical protein [Euryarchaeota archaeon]
MPQKIEKPKALKGFLAHYQYGDRVLVPLWAANQGVNHDEAKHQSVYTTLAIGSVELPNRIAFSAWAGELCEYGWNDLR